jgi:hypothetical protein
LQPCLDRFGGARLDAPLRQPFHIVERFEDGGDLIGHIVGRLIPEQREERTVDFFDAPVATALQQRARGVLELAPRGHARFVQETIA